MGRLHRVLLAAAALVAGGAGASSASSCVWTPVICIGENGGPCPTETAEQRLAREQRDSAAETQRRLDDARARLRAGTVDLAAELSELLVPNVRPVQVAYSDCGLMGEVDFGAGGETPESLFSRLVAGTQLASANMGEMPASVLRRGLIGFGEPCNAEFRRSFVEYLRRTMAERHLRRAWLFLEGRRRDVGYSRLVRFRGGQRTPPWIWQASAYWLTDELRRFVRSDSSGRRLSDAVESFWTEHASALGDDERVCPVTAAEWAALRARLVPELVTALEARRRRSQP